MQETLLSPPGPFRMYDLRQKDVINIRTCRSLGYITDLEIDPRSGCILSLIVPGEGRLFCLFGRDFDYIIPWRCIVRIGADIILIDVEENEVRKKNVVKKSEFDSRI